MTKHGDFEALPRERQDEIIRAGIEMFGRYDYKNARAEDIARRAGISKGLLFFYFRNKRALYMYLMERLADTFGAAVADEHFYAIDDFFELLLYVAHEKSAFFADHPYVLDFCVRAFILNIATCATP